MTKTLQEKIDNYPNPVVMYKIDLDKAIQELREEIISKDRACPCHAGYVQLREVLALIGEKK